MSLKPKLSVYWASSCGGCEIAVVNLHENFLKLAEHFELVFCPCLMDTKIADVEAMPDASIALTLFNGAIRTEENDEMARLLRRKSKLLVAYGACSYQGGIPALSNFSSRKEHLQTIYGENASLDNLAQLSPQNHTEVAEGTLELPVFYENVKTLAQCVKVDYFMPGCPPEPHQIWSVMEGIINGQPLPPPGSVIGAGTSSVCDECARERSIKVLPRFYRTFEVAPDPVKCLLEQGIVCMGIATRDGCGAPCPNANMPCTGCYGPPEGVRDQGAKMVSALGSILELGEYKGMTPEELTQKVDELLNSIPDPAGTYYRYGAAGSILGGKAQ
jgi:F420-non-reducing hydrogenase small subunit